MEDIQQPRREQAERRVFFKAEPVKTGNEFIQLWLFEELFQIFN
jgi:hypothetical protein